MYQIDRVGGHKETIRQNVFYLHDGTEMEYLTFPLLEATGIVKDRKSVV